MPSSAATVSGVVWETKFCSGPNRVASFWLARGCDLASSERLVAVPTGLEPVTFGLGNRCSIRLSYGTIAQRVLRADRSGSLN